MEKLFLQKKKSDDANKAPHVNLDRVILLEFAALTSATTGALASSSVSSSFFPYHVI